MLKISGESLFIIIFCVTYALMANVQSRMYPVPGSIAYRQRAWVSEKINRIDREEQKALCEAQAIRVKSDDKAIIWYHNKQTGEYWCGYIVLGRLTKARANELKGHTTILNSDKNIRRLQRSENNKHKRKQGSVPKITER